VDEVADKFFSVTTSTIVSTALGFSSIANLTSSIEFISKDFHVFDYMEHLVFNVVKSVNYVFKHGTVKVNINISKNQPYTPSILYVHFFIQGYNQEESVFSCMGSDYRERRRISTSFHLVDPKTVALLEKL